MKLEIQIDSRNDAMLTREEAAAALRRLALKVLQGDEGGKVMDANGQSVGVWSIDDEGEGEEETEEVNEEG
jgi:hypothetical protein